MLRVAEDGVEHHGQGETGDCAKKEGNEDELIFKENVTTAMITERLDIEDDGDDDEPKKTQKMSPNVSSFRVKTKYRLDTFIVTIQLWPVMAQDKLIVSHPCLHLGKENVIGMLFFSGYIS